MSREKSNLFAQDYKRVNLAFLGVSFARKIEYLFRRDANTKLNTKVSAKNSVSVVM